MKKLLTNGILVVLAIGLLYIIYLRECNRDPCPPDGYSLIANSTLDSIRALADKPNDTITIRDTIPGEPVIVEREVPVPVVIAQDTLAYQDSVVNDSINVKSRITVKGELLSWTWEYIPITFHTTTTIKEYVPKLIDNPVPTPQNGFYLSGLIGGNAEAFAPGISIDWITKKEYLYGFQYQRMSGKSFYSIKVGIRLFR